MQTTALNTFGNLTNDPVTRTNKNNQVYTVFTVAHNPAEGQREFVKCFVWGKTQQKFAGKLQKGNRVHIIGQASDRAADNGDKITFVTLDYFRHHPRTEQAAA